MLRYSLSPFQCVRLVVLVGLLSAMNGCLFKRGNDDAAEDTGGTPDPGAGDDTVSSCADGWDGKLQPGYILSLQEGGASSGDEGGDIHAFMSDGCYLGKVFNEPTPWYAYGLKTSAQQYDTNFVEVSSASTGDLSMPILQWVGTSSATAGFTLGTPAIPTDGNSGNTGYNDLEQVYFQVAFSPLFDSTHRFVAYNSQNKIKSYQSGTVVPACEVSVGSRIVSDITASISSGGNPAKAFYIWTTPTTGANYGVASLTPCYSSSVTHTNLFSEAGSNLRATGVMEVRSTGSAWNNNILATVGAYFGGTQGVYRWYYNGSAWVNAGEPFADRAHAVVQSTYRTGSFSASYGDIYTVESDSTNVYLRRRSVASGSEGTLVSTLYTEVKGAGPVFKSGFSPTGTWLAIVPPAF